MKNLDWVRDLVEAERRMEETGMIDLSAVQDDALDLKSKTFEFLKSIKEGFIEYSTAFNSMKNATVGAVKIYGISNTMADFMLFRNGYKLLFTVMEPGRIAINFQTQTSPFLASGPAGASAFPNNPQEEYLDAKYGPFGEMTWTYRGTPINPDYLVRYYLTRFIRESAK